MVKTSSSCTPNSCSIKEEVFDQPYLSAYGGAALFVDLLRHELNLRDMFADLPCQKAPWATFTLADVLESLVVSYALGIERIDHVDEVEHDPLLCRKLGLKKLPHQNTLYRALERFDDAERIRSLGDVNQKVIAGLFHGQTHSILDIDTTVETVHGRQEGTCVSYNPRYPGRRSYQPLIAFEGQSQSTVEIGPHSGHPPNATEKIAFYRQAKSRLPRSAPVRFVRADKGFTSEAFCSALEKDEVGYALKTRLTKGLCKRLTRGVLWIRVPSNETTAVEVASFGFKADSWSRHRRIVLVRTRFLDDSEPRLFAEYAWEYQAIVTNLDWESLDIWHFYNQRCNCENFIKELKQGLRIDAISKDGFWANAADLWLKALAYNALLHLKAKAPKRYSTFSIQRFRRALLRIPAQLTNHSRKWVLHLPKYWPHQAAWRHLRGALHPV